MRVIFVLIIMSFCLTSKADVLTVDYSSFYSHLRKIDNEDTPALQFAFGFKKVGTEALCTIESAKIVTQKVSIPIDVSPEQRFLLPTEKALKQARAVVEITLQEASNQCDMSVQLETKPEYLKTHYASEDLEFMFDQYKGFFDDMGSFLSFLMPSVEGLHFHFDKTLDEQYPAGITVDQNHVYVSRAWVEQGNTLSFETAPNRITAVTGE